MRAFKVLALVLGLLAMAQQSTQLSLNNPLHGVIRKINEAGSYIGLVLVSSNDERALLDSNVFVPSNHIPTLLLAGRTFNIGEIKGANVIYVKTGDASVNAAATVQLLIDTFSIQGIVHYGSAGSVNDTLFIGDVSVPGQVAFTGSWEWRKYGSDKGLIFGDYNYPEAGSNLLGSVNTQPTVLYTADGKNKTIFWLPINSTWFDIATQLQSCNNVLTRPSAFPEHQNLFSDCEPPLLIYIQNAAYREYLYTKFKVSTVDQETAAIALVALSNEVPFVVFRGVSNTAGGSTQYKSYKYLGSLNAFNAAVGFIDAVSVTSSRASY